jgi:predicted ATPase
MRGGYFEIRSERVRRLPEGKLLYESQYGIGDLFEGKGSPKGPGHHPLPVGTLESVLSQVKGPGAPPEIDSLGKLFSKIRLYRDWNLGRNAPAREAQLADLKTDFLAEDARNLVLVLAELQRRTETRQALAEHFRRFHPDFEEFVSSPVGGGRMQLFLREKGMREDLPATRLSDGTMRYLALLAVLCHPEPPPLVCIEEPELGLHPDIIPTIAELLVSASERTQLIVTTHSDILISALSDHPEAVVVCEKDSGGTTLERLQPEKLQKWLERYSLGDLWLKGTIGGTRW